MLDGIARVVKADENQEVVIVLDFPRIHGHRLRQLSSSPRTRPVNGGPRSSDDAPDCEHFDVLERSLFGMLAREVAPVMDELLLERAEESSRRRRCPSSCPCGSWSRRCRRMPEAPGNRRRILHPAIRVVQQPLGSLAPPDGHRERPVARLAVRRFPGPADDGPRVEIEHHREIQPALVGPDVGDVAGPDPVRLVDRELPIERMAATGNRCAESVVARHFFTVLARIPSVRVSLKR